MSEEFIAACGEAPEAGPMMALTQAQTRAMITLLTELHGRKAGLRYMELVEENLVDVQDVGNVVLIRGEDQRRTTLRNRNIAFRWWWNQSPLFQRAIRKA